MLTHGLLDTYLCFKYAMADVSFKIEKGEEWKVNRESRQGEIQSPLIFNFCIKWSIEEIVNHDVDQFIWQMSKDYLGIEPP